jgi:hypothetical protein
MPRPDQLNGLEETCRRKILVQALSWLNGATPGDLLFGVAHPSFFITFLEIYAVPPEIYEHLIPHKHFEKNFTLFRSCTFFS